MKNREVAAALNELADSMELLGEDRFRVANYRDAATRIEHHHEPIEVMAHENRVQQIHGVGNTRDYVGLRRWLDRPKGG